MTNNISNWNATRLIEELKNNGFGESTSETAGEGIGEDIIAIHQKQELPFALRISVGFGAFLASILFFLYIFISILNSSDVDYMLIGSGLFAIAAATILQRCIKDDTALSYHFLEHMALTSAILGYILLFVGLLSLFSDWYACMIIFIVTCFVYPFYRLSVARFLMVLSVLCFVLVNIINSETMHAVLFNGFILFQCLSIAVLFRGNAIKPSRIPLCYAFIFSLCTSLLYLTSPLISDFFHYAHSPIFTNVILLIGFLGLLGAIAGGKEKLKSEPFILASLGALLLSIISAPGILFAIGLIILGYAMHEKLLSLIGILFLVLFLVLYYYNLHTSLLIKSFILMGSGSLLLASRVYLKYRGLV